eukprot:2684410-Rhodomonas_salina.1
MKVMRRPPRVGPDVWAAARGVASETMRTSRLAWLALAVDHDARARGGLALTRRAAGVSVPRKRGRRAGVGARFGGVCGVAAKGL